MNNEKSTYFYGWFIFALAASFYCFEYFLRIAPGVMEDQLRASFHLTAMGYANLFSTYYYIYTPMQLFVGILLDRYSPRLLLALNCLFCAIGAYLFATAQTLFVAEAGRFLMGFGSAFAFVGVLKLATIWLPPKRFALVTGMTTMLGVLGGMFGQRILTPVVIEFGWRETLFYSAVVGFILSVLIFLFLGKKNNEQNFVTHQLESFLALKRSLKIIFLNWQVWLAGIIGALAYLSSSAFAEVWSVTYVQAVHHWSQANAADASSFIFLGWAVGSPLAGFLSGKFNNRRNFLVGGGLLTTLSFLLVLYFPTLSETQTSILLFCVGLFSSVQNLVFARAVEVVPVEFAGTVLAFTNMLVMMGGVLIQPIIGWLLDHFWDGQTAGDHLRIYSPHDYQLAMLVLPIAYFLVAVLSFLGIKKQQT